MPNGILIIDKPAGWTSQDVVAKLRGVFHEKRVGHGGTLDPMATGVLPVFLGRATRAVPFFEHADKVYEAELRLGLVTDTQDVTGRTLEEHPVDITQEQFEAALARFRGEIQQIPPMYSAIKVNGQKLYQLARKGKEVEREARTVTIYELEAIGNRQQAIGDGGREAAGKAFPLRAELPGGQRDFSASCRSCAPGNGILNGGRCPSAHTGADEVVHDAAPSGDGGCGLPRQCAHWLAMTESEAGSRPDTCPLSPVPCHLSPVTCHLKIHCSKGTYVRTLCHDIGAALGCGGCMAALRRTRAGRYGIEEAHTLEEILAAPDPEALLLPVDSLFSDRPALRVNENAERKLRNGAAVGTLNAVDGEYRVYAESGEFLLLGRVTKGQLNTVKSFFEL